MNGPASPKEPTMDTELRRYQVETHHQALRAEAANERLARGRQDRIATAVTTVHATNRIDALLHAIATMTTVRLADPAHPIGRATDRGPDPAQPIAPIEPEPMHTIARTAIPIPTAWARLIGSRRTVAARRTVVTG